MSKMYEEDILIRLGNMTFDNKLIWEEITSPSTYYEAARGCFKFSFFPGSFRYLEIQDIVDKVRLVTMNSDILSYQQPLKDLEEAIEYQVVLTKDDRQRLLREIMIELS